MKVLKFGLGPVLRLCLWNRRKKQRRTLSNNHSNSSIHSHHTSKQHSCVQGIWAHRPSIKGTKLLFIVIKAIIIIHCGSAFEPGASGLPYYCTSTCVRSWCNWRAGCVDSNRPKKKPSAFFIRLVHCLGWILKPQESKKDPKKYKSISKQTNKHPFTYRVGRFRIRVTQLLRTTFMRSQRLGGLHGVATYTQTNHWTNKQPRIETSICTCLFHIHVHLSPYLCVCMLQLFCTYHS